MLVLSRKQNEQVIINGNIRIHVVGINGNKVRLGIEAPKEIGILRGELVNNDDRAELQENGPLAQSTVESPELDFSVDYAVEIEL